MLVYSVAINSPTICEVDKVQLKTYTGLWHVENRLYKFYDINLPFPIAVKQLVIGICTFVPWFFLMHFTGIPLKPPFGELIWLIPPGFLTWWGNRPVAEGKNLMDFLSSQIRYMMSSKTYAGLTPTKIDNEPIFIEGRIWSKG